MTFEEQWHEVLSERNGLRGELDDLTDAVRRHHEDHHAGAIRWCEALPCRLSFQGAEGRGRARGERQ
ncbi:hypothetical protein [Amycolatopsis sp. cg13]|uniref:hypothetical protein n=1 Tax=Amycolatopsis sp. cg13 TaxID=3238807 RepID=UPI0035262FE2